MSRLHKGAYMDLLMAQVNNGHMSLKQIKNLLGKEDENLWEEILCDKFKKDAEGKYYNQKIEDVVNKKKLYAESRLKNLSSHKDTHMDGHMEEEEEDRDIDNKEKREEFSKKREEKERILKEREERFRKAVMDCIVLAYPEDMLKKFADYWTEPNKSGTKLRYELEKTWHLGRRLSTWAARSKDMATGSQGMRTLTYPQLLQKINELGRSVNDIYRPVLMDGKEKPIWIHIEDIQKHNLTIYKK